MDEQSEWMREIFREIDNNKRVFNETDLKTFKIDLLVMLAKRIEELEGDCPQCPQYKMEITAEQRNE